MGPTKETWPTPPPSWPTKQPSNEEWPTPQPTKSNSWPSEKETDEPTKDGWPTPQPSEKTTEEIWPTEQPVDDKWPSEKKTDEPTKDEWPTPQPSKSTTSWPSEKKKDESEDAINLLSASKWSAKTANGETDPKMTTTQKPEDDKYKKALVVVWNPLDLLTFLQLIGILVVLLTFCFVARGVCFGPRNRKKGAKIVSDYDSDDITDSEDDLEKQHLER